MSLASFGVRKPVVVNLLMIGIILAGVVFGSGLRREFFPEVRPNLVLIAAPYPGATPDEVEESLAIKIEDRIAELEGVKEINSTCLEGAATVQVELKPGYAIEDAVARIKREVDALQDLPEQAERITVQELEPTLPAITLSLFGQADERTMKDAIADMRDDLRTLDGMGQISVAGVRTDEITVEIHPDLMIKHNIGLPAIAQRIRDEMAELPGGAVRTSNANIAIRTVGAEERAQAVREIVVRSTRGGRPITLGDIATVTEGFADVDLATRVNGQPSVSLTAFAEGDEDVVEIANLVAAYAAGRMREPIQLSLRERIAMFMSERNDRSEKPRRVVAYELGLARDALPPGDLLLHNNISRFVQQRLELLSRNALWGGMLVFATLVLLLAPRVALWVTVGLIISLLGTLAIMRATGMTLNFLTMFGLIVVLGLLVDDAIVVAENIKARHERGEPALRAAVTGTLQVEWPVIATVLTTICAFFPLRMIEGQIGDLMGAVPLVVMAALSVSLVESLLILPSHMAHSLHRIESRRPGRVQRFLNRIDHARTTFFHDVFALKFSEFLAWCLQRRYVAVVVAISVLIASFGMVAGKRVEFVFIESADSETVMANLVMPIGTPMHRTEEIVTRIEAAAQRTPETSAVFSIIGSQQDPNGGVSVNQSHIAQVILELKPIERRDRPSDEVVDSIRADLGTIPGIKSLRFDEIQGGPGGPGITYTVVGDSARRIHEASEQLKDALAEFDGVHSIADDADRGQRELRFKLRPGATELGFTTESIARQVRGAVFGLEAHTFAGDREDVDVRVMFDEESRRSLAAIESMRVFSPSGVAVPIGEIVDMREAEGYAAVRRLDRRRAVTVQADVFNDIVSPEEVSAALAPVIREIQAEHPGVRILPRGRQKEMADAFSTLPLGMLAAVVMIYIILAWLFSSYFQPVLVLSAVPFAAAGVIWGHYFLGFNLTILSMIGFVALTGIVVNDSLILTEFYNHKRREGLSVYEALVAAGRARLRAIVLTTMTTVLGLSPLMLEQSFQARFLIPMAITISFGLLSATLVILIVLPCLLLIGDDLQRLARWAWWGGRPPAPIASTPAAAIGK